MIDERPCCCSDGCSGLRGGPGCTSEPAPTGGYRPPYLAARAHAFDAIFRDARHENVRCLCDSDDYPFRAERGDSGRDYGDEHVERGGPCVPR